MSRTPHDAHKAYWSHLPHTAENLPCGCVIVTFAGVRYRLRQDGERARCELEDDKDKEWAMKQVEGMVKA